jgi:glycosidase
MVTYLLPLDTGSFTPTTLPHIKAIFAYNNPNNLAAVVTLKINGVDVNPVPAYYDTLKKTLDYPLSPGQLNIGSNTIIAGINIHSVSITKSIVLNEESDPKFDLLTEDMIYKKANIVVYGKITTGQITGININLNGTDYSTMPDANNNIIYPVTLKEDTNIVTVTVSSTYGTKSKTQKLVYTPDNQPVIVLSNSINGRSLSFTANAISPGGYGISYLWYQDPGNPTQISLGDVTSQNIQLNISGTTGEYIFKVKVTDSRGRFNTAGYLVKSGVDSLHIEGISEHPGWVDNMRLYEIYTPTYGQSQFGLKGVLEKINYLADLGINAIWLTPIFDGNYNGYATKNYYKINPALGTSDDLKAIVSAAHQKGIKVLLDLVINHTWTSHPFFQNILNLKSASPFANYYMWLGIPGASTFSYYYNWTDLPNLNVNNPETESYFFGVAEYWIREFDIDGYRCDVAWGIEERNNTFWQEMRRRIKNLKPEAFLLAESPADNNQEGHTLDIFNNKFDAAYDWELRGFGNGALYSILKGTSSNIASLNSVITKSYPVNSYAMRLIEDHDFPRATVDFPNLSKLAHTVTFTMNGIPLIYGGGEVGELTQLGNINWSDPNGYEPYFQKLLDIRKRYIANNDRVTILSNSGSALTDCWITQSDTSNILTIANFGSSSSSFTVNFAGSIKDTNIFLYDIFNNTSLQIYNSQLNTVIFNLSGYTSKVYSLQKSDPTSIQNKPGVVYSFKLNQNYPNPFNPSTIIRYSVPEKSKVTLKIYDILGRELITLLNEEINAGEHEVNFNASGLSSGVYFYTLKSNNNISTKKMLLLK